jgi:hypothetical protein
LDKWNNLRSTIMFLFQNVSNQSARMKV